MNEPSVSDDFVINYEQLLTLLRIAVSSCIPLKVGKLADTNIRLIFCVQQRIFDKLLANDARKYFLIFCSENKA